jgi:hypothetical protein
MRSKLNLNELKIIRLYKTFVLKSVHILIDRSGSPLATLYGTSIMENHHFNHCILILNTEV